jgi:lipoprotein-releasing system permease protein
MNVEYFISKRLVSAKENKNVFSRPIIRITISAIALSVAVMIISLSVLDGFKSEVMNKVISFGSHIQIENYQDTESDSFTPLVLTEPFLQSIYQNKEIKSVQPIIYDFGLVKTKDDFLGINLKGVSDNYDWNLFSQQITEGELLNSDSSIVISENIANKLKLHLSDKINIYFPSLKKDRIKVRPFYVCGIYNTSMGEFDNSLTFVSSFTLQKLKKWNENEVSMLEITLHDFDDLDVVSSDLSTSVEDYYSKKVSSITYLYPQIFDWLSLQDINVRVIIILMLLVAGVNVVSSLLILILEKTKFIGIIKSLGATNWMVRKIFLYNSMYLVSKGLFLGNLLAFTLLFLQYQFQIISLDETTYYMKSIPISFNFYSFFFLNLGTLILSFLMMIIPTLVITKISTVKAIRFQ